MVVYWLKHVKDNKLKYQHLSITLDYVLKILFFRYFIYITFHIWQKLQYLYLYKLICKMDSFNHSSVQ
jgi:hypothetical protein